MLDRRDPILDEWLVLQSQQGDRPAFERLIERWQERLWRHAFRLTGNEAAAWDVLQETWLAVTRAMQRLDDPARFRSWAYTIVTRQAATHHRRKGREPALESLQDVAAPAAAPPETAPVERLRAALRTLPGDDQALLALKYQEEFDGAEIGRILGIPEGTVKSRLHHARQRLRAAVERMEP